MDQEKGKMQDTMDAERLTVLSVQGGSDKISSQ
jgi:hypothetical protein